MNRKIEHISVLIATVFSAPLTSHVRPTKEVPFTTSPDNVTLEMPSVAGVKRGDHVIDWGSGDGRICGRRQEH